MFCKSHFSLTCKKKKKAKITERDTAFQNILRHVELFILTSYFVVKSQGALTLKEYLLKQMNNGIKEYIHYSAE